MDTPKWLTTHEAFKTFVSPKRYNGSRIRPFPSKTKPDDPEVIKVIEAELAKK